MIDVYVISHSEMAMKLLEKSSQNNYTSLYGTMTQSTRDMRQ